MFDMLHKALSDVLEYESGNLHLSTKKIFVPGPPKNYRAEQIKKLRKKLNFSQSALANWLNVSLNAVQAWEQGLRNPSQAALRLLDIFDKDFSSIEAMYTQKSKQKKKKSTTVGTTEKFHERMIAKPKYYSLKKKIK